MTTLDDFSQAQLNHGEYPVTMEKRIGMVAWALAEGDINVPRCSGATWNPEDTEEPAPGATNFNAAGVKNYPDALTGIDAWYATLKNGYYPNVIAVLEDEGASAMSLAQAVGNSPWGTGNFSRQVEIVKSDIAKYFAVEVPGEGEAPAPAPGPQPHKETDMVIVQANGVDWLVGAAGKSWIGTPEDVAALQAAGVQMVSLSQQTLDRIPTCGPSPS